MTNQKRVLTSSTESQRRPLLEAQPGAPHALALAALEPAVLEPAALHGEVIQVLGHLAPGALKVPDR